MVPSCIKSRFKVGLFWLKKYMFKLLFLGVLVFENYFYLKIFVTNTHDTSNMYDFDFGDEINTIKFLKIAKNVIF